VPPYILEAVAENSKVPETTREAARHSLSALNAARQDYQQKLHAADAAQHPSPNPPLETETPRYRSRGLNSRAREPPRVSAHVEEVLSSPSEFSRRSPQRRPTAESIVPPYILDAVSDSEFPAVSPQARAAARHTAEAARITHTERHVAAAAAAQAAVAASAGEEMQLYREIRDAQNHDYDSCQGQIVLLEDYNGFGNNDPVVAEVFENFGHVWKFYKEVLKRNSLNDKGMHLVGVVHWGSNIGDAFWKDGRVCFGDGDGKIFGRFTSSLEVVGHELTHGVTQYTANLLYENQSGALNESISDVFGSLVKQWKVGATVDEADWLIGEDGFMPGQPGVAVRSMKDPGTAYDATILGRGDPQPGHMSGFINTTDDYGGVHTNSGIPNRAFYLAAKGFRGHAWDKAGRIWYAAITSQSLPPRCEFRQFAYITMAKATELYGQSGAGIVQKAWEDVGVIEVRLRIQTGLLAPITPERSDDSSDALATAIDPIEEDRESRKQAIPEETSDIAPRTPNDTATSAEGPKTAPDDRDDPALTGVANGAESSSGDQGTKDEHRSTWRRMVRAGSKLSRRLACM
jgi:Zn-dependent metalloprotease